MVDVLSAVDFSTVTVWVVAVGIVIVGIAMAFKGIELAKRAVNEVDDGDRPAVWSHNRYDTNKADGSRRNFHSNY